MVTLTLDEKKLFKAYVQKFYSPVLTLFETSLHQSCNLSLTRACNHSRSVQTFEELIKREIDKTKDRRGIQEVR